MIPAIVMDLCRVALRIGTLAEQYLAAHVPGHSAQVDARLSARERQRFVDRAAIAYIAAAAHLTEDAKGKDLVRDAYDAAEALWDEREVRRTARALGGAR